MIKGIKAFSLPQYDYYELLQDLGGIVPKGAIFVHDTNDNVSGSPAEGCLKLCWTPDGDVYLGTKGGVCGGTVIFHAEFRKSDMFRKVKGTDSNIVEKAITCLENCISNLRELMK